MPKMLVSPEDREKLSLKSGDLVVVRSGSVGRAAVFDRTDIDCIPSAYMIQFRFEESVVPNYVRYYFQSPFVKDELNGRGTALKNINAQKIKLVKIPVPSLPEQHRIVAYLDNLQAKVDEMKGVREQAIQELDALLPSILDKAFKGEL
jgi:type I restriction enzyme S subunit